jgi:hypothetical protein
LFCQITNEVKSRLTVENDGNRFEVKKLEQERRRKEKPSKHHIIEWRADGYQF